jgi:hypothetical protein
LRFVSLALETSPISASRSSKVVLIPLALARQIRWPAHFRLRPPADTLARLAHHIPRRKRKR